MSAAELGALRAVLRAEPLEDRLQPSAPSGLLLFTNGNVNNSMTPGLSSWTGATVLDVSNPNFALGPGTTNGTFSALFNLNNFTAAGVKLSALDYVHQAVTVGSGSASVALLPGDLLLSVNQNNSTLTSQNTLRVQQDDVFVFRPVAGGNYSSGTFLPLFTNLNALAGVGSTLGIDVVESQTAVGDVTIPSGAFLLVSQNGGGGNVQLFKPTAAGAGQVAGSISTLINGSDIGAGGRLNGLYLVDRATALGGQTLPAGTLLLAQDGGSIGVGASKIATNQFDVIQLRVSKTTLGSGKAVVTPAILFDGSDVNMNGGEEVIRGFSLADDGILPPIAVDDSYSTNENASLTVAAASGVLANDSDPNGYTLAAALGSGPAHGSVALNADGGFTYIPTAYYSGPDSFTYTASDGLGGSATATAHITVNAVNQPPSFTLSGNPPAVNENSGPQTVTGFATGISPGPNEGQQTVTFLVTGNSNPALFGVAPAIAPDGTLTYTPAANASGTATITVVAKDNGGTANGGQDTSASKQFTITVRPVNYPPTIDPIADVTTPENSGTQTITLTGITAGAGQTEAIGVTATSSDPSLIPNPTITYTSPNSTGTLSFTPTANASGTATITVTVRNAGLNGYLGDADDGITTRQFTVTVTAVPLPPVANPDTYNTPGGVQLVISALGVLANDTDPNGNALTASVVSGPANGTLALHPDGSFTYTPNSGFSGVDTFTYQATDSASLTSGVTTVTINVGLANRSPVAVDDSYTTPEGVSVSGNVTANDSDPDGDPLSVSLLGSGPAHGSLTLNPDGTFTYTPTANFSGSDSFQYTLSDGRGGTAPATVQLTVTPVNHPPVAVNDSATVNENGSAAVSVLANDTDPDGDPLTVVAVTQPANGTVTTNGTSVTYIPNGYFHGTDSFSYTISDGHGGTASATVTMTVNAVPQTPTLDPLADLSVPENSGPQAVPLSGLTAGPNGNQPLTVTATSSNPALIANPTVSYSSPDTAGTLTFTPIPNASGSTVVTVTVSDGVTTTRSFTVTVVPFHNPPTITPVADQTVTAGHSVGPLGFTVGDVETPGGSLVVSATSDNPALIPDSNLAITSAGGGGRQLELTPLAHREGSAVITLAVSDGQAITTTSFTVHVVPDTPTAVSESYSTSRGTSLAVPPAGILIQDSDADGDALTATLVSGPAHGTLQLNPDGSFIYAPAPGFTGTDSFTYRAVDSSGNPSGTATVTISVTAVEQPPPPPQDPTPTPAPAGPLAPAPAPAPQQQPLRLPPGLGGNNTGVDSTGGSASSSAPADPADSGSTSADALTAAPPATGHTEPLYVVFAFSAPAGPDNSLPAPLPPQAIGLGNRAPSPAPPTAVAHAPEQPPIFHTPPAATAPVSAPAVRTPVSPELDAEVAADVVGEGAEKVARDLGSDSRERAATDAVVATTAVASAGYVLLNTRAVYWLISALLARPAVWRRFDPLDVIYSWEEEQALGHQPAGPGAESGESLQSMVG